MKEIRWHARAGQGAKTAAQLLALALLRTGRSVQAFPEYGPERRGAPLRAYTRVDDRPIRRHDGIETPDLVVVLEPSLANDPSVTAGLGPEGALLVNGDDTPPCPGRAVAVPALRIAEAAGSSFVNLVMLGAAAAALREPPLDDLVTAAMEQLGRKLAPEAIRATVEGGWHAVSTEETRWAA
jgi:pyruvate ferredoxin oxidoreductase gamma subunit